MYLKPLGEKVKWFRLVVLSLGILAHRGLLAIPGDIFGCHNWYAAGIYWVEATEAAENHTVHSTGPQNKDMQLKMTINSVSAEKPYSSPLAGRGI